MILKRIKLPVLIFIYAGIVLAALVCIICTLYQEKAYMEQELLKWQNEASQLREEASQFKNEASELKNELSKIYQYTHVYQTKPEIVATVMQESEKFGINPAIMLELIKTESNFNPLAVSRHGATGLCQIKPTTARVLSQELNLVFGEKKLFDIRYNIHLGTYYLSKLLAVYNMDYHQALTAYNRGPKGLEKHIKNKGTAISTYSKKINHNSIELALKIAS